MALSQPGVFTSPASGTILQGGQSYTVSWGASTDPEGHSITYLLQYSTNGGSSYTNVGTWSSSTSQTVTMPTSGTSIIFRVRAKDSKGATSSYRTSGTYTLQQNSPPTLTMKKADGTTITNGQSIAIPYNTDFVVKLTPNDPDASDTIQYTILVNNITKVPYTNATKGTEISYTVSKSDLAVGFNSVTIKVKDSKNAETVQTFSLTIQPQAPIDWTCLSNMKWSGYNASTISLSELINYIS